MKKAIALLMSLITILAALTACSGKDSDIPEGMQLVRGGEEIGYYMYAPEEWIVANQEELGIACTYVSKINNTSVTLTEASFTEGTIETYVASELEKFTESFALEHTFAFKEDALGNAEKAWKIGYTYKYGEYTYQVMQIFAIYKGRSYILTYSASAGTYDGEVSYYEKFLEKAQDIIKNIRFVEKVGGVSAAPEYPKDADGYSLVSDEKLCGFNMYIPDSYKLDFATSMVSVTRADGSNITVSEATDTNTDSVGYWTTRFETLADLGAVVALSDPEKDIKDSQQMVELGGSIRATSLKYSISFQGKTYLVYQVLIVKGFNGYVFTYTANESNFDGNFAEMQTILNKIEF